MELSHDSNILKGQLQSVAAEITELQVPYVWGPGDKSLTRDLMRFICVLFRHNTVLKTLDIRKWTIVEGRDTNNLRELFRHNRTIEHLSMKIACNIGLSYCDAWMGTLRLLIKNSGLKTIRILTETATTDIQAVFDMLKPDLLENLSLTKLRINGRNEFCVTHRNRSLPYLIRKSIVTLLAVRKYRSKNTTFMLYVPKEIIREIAIYMWMSRLDLKWLDLWSNLIDKPPF